MDSNAAAWLLDRHLREGHGDRPALVGASGEVSYAELTNLAASVGTVFSAAGVGRGERVLVVLPDSAVALACILGLMRAGAVPVPVSPVLSAEEQLYVARDCDAAAVVFDGAATTPVTELAARRPERMWAVSAGTTAGVRDLLRELAEASEGTEAARVAPDDVAILQYTSGSTGRPKGVVHLHGGLLAAPGCFGAQLALTPADRVLSTAKLSFGYGFGNSVLFPLAAGASAVLYEGPAEVHAIAGLLRKHHPTVLCAVPAFYAAVLRLPDAGERIDLSGVRLLVSAGEHLTQPLAKAWAETFELAITNGLGSTECLHIFLATRPGVSVSGSSGRPVPRCAVRVVDESGQPVAKGGPGQLLVHAPTNAAGYWGDPIATARTFHDGWVRTGDVLVELDDGDWQHLGRSDDMINAGGVKVAPQEIEAQVAAHPSVAECAVVGRRHGDYDLEQLVAFVVARDDAGNEGELRRLLRRHLRETIPQSKRPTEVVFVDELPRTSTGKVARFRLRERVAAPEAAS